MKATRVLRWLPACVSLCVLTTSAFADGEVTFGGQWWDQTAPEAFYQQYRDMPRGAFLESFLLRQWPGKDYVSLSGVNAMRRDQKTDFTFARGRAWLDLGYQEVPHLFSLVGRTPYLESALGRFRLPDTLQRVNQEFPTRYDSTMADLLRNAAFTDLDLQTRISRGRLRLRPAEGWSFDVRGVQRLRSGSKPLGAAFGFNSVIELPGPIRERIDDVDAIADYQRGRLKLEASGGGSWYLDDLDRIFWDNPKRLTDRTAANAYIAGDGTSAGQMAAPPDNQVLRGSLALGMQLPKLSTFNATVSLARSTQNEDWLPYTVNTAIRQPDSLQYALPGRSPDAKALTTNLDARFVTRAVSKLTGTLRVQHYRYDNQTDVHVFPGAVRLDQVWEPGPFATEPFGHARTQAGADVDVAATRRLSLGASYDWIQRKHDDREVEKDAESVFGARARFRPMLGVSLEAKYRHGDRQPDQVLEAALEGEQPGLRRYDVAGRKQDDVSAGLGWAPMERFDLNASWRFVHNDYDESSLGLQDERQNTAMTVGTWHATDRLDVSQGFGWTRTESRQRSATSGATIADPDTAWWSAELSDENTFLFGTVDWDASAKLTLSAGYEVSRSAGTYDLANVQGNARDLPGTLYRRYDVSTEARYRWTATLDLAARWAWEQYDVHDFANQFVPLQELSATATGGVFTNAIYLGDSSLGYRAHRVALVARYRF